LKKTKSIIFHNILTLIKNLNSLEGKEDYEIQIDKEFFKENKTELLKRIKLLKLKFSIKFNEIEKELNAKIFEIDTKIFELINNKSKENIQRNTPMDIKSEKSYRRKIKKKSIENTN